jgi:hypothetical protein
MPLINYASREIQSKIVYYGPALAGKTANLIYIHSRIGPAYRGDLVSLAASADRTFYTEYYLPQNARSSAEATAARRHYRLRCSVCSAAFDDDGFVLQCPIEPIHGLLVSDYSAKQFERDEHDESIYRF